ncbi:hypothetical protein F5X96DRAFT_676631 [Biscogniauxia mediterranea]|nr:hypothetical protein F5X96DRAFT_676631 [Biscogniauxia mediterranea]
MANPAFRAKKKQTPQEAIDEFWSKFTTKTPGKATTVIPHNEYAEKAARRSNQAVGTLTQTSYEEAAAVCRAKVDKIVKECRRVNQKYRDPHFDLELDLKWGGRDTLESLCNVKEKPESAFKPKSVKRVVDIFDQPKFYIDGPSANDVRQGRDGDCWLLAALCTLSNKPSLIERVCVARDEQVGVYGFVFHRDGEWISEIIDDKLFLTKPDFDESFLERMLWEDRERVNSEEQYRKAYQSGSGALYFAQCEHADETWLPLLEKAYAKAHGDYAAIEGGFTGEGIEDLTGGVTTELYSTDILDKEHFWREELMKVNDEFLFGCSTGMWGGSYWGERKGIVELHAYSVMRAVELDGQRLVLLKNPWGKGEWRGPWSDGSKEWTADWLLKLNHRFGDDGNFWISYDDLLRKYQAFDRTRLFGPEWKVTSLWTTFSVPWTLDYHDTYFTFSLAKTGPVVIVLSQLDDRYYRGLEGQYRFELNFRLHKKGQEDYVVRSISPYCQNRSVNVELELEAGDYVVLLKVNATRDLDILPIEEVIRNNARQRRDKLVAVGMSYDLAHSKGKVTETPEEKQAKKDAEKRRKDKEREELRKKIMDARRTHHYFEMKDHKKRKEKRAKAKAKAKKQARKAKRAAAKIKAKEEARRKKGQEAAAREKHVQVLSPSQTPEPDAANKYLPPESGTEATVKALPSTGSDKPPAEPTGKTASDTPAEPKSEASDSPPPVPGVPPTTITPPSPSSEAATAAATSDDSAHAVAGSEERRPTHEATNATEDTELSEADDDDDSEDDDSDLSSVSEISDRELDIQLRRRMAHGSHGGAPPPRSPPPGGPGAHPPHPPGAASDSEDEFESDPWNAVVTVGLRVYHKVSSSEEEKEMVKLNVVRPSGWAKDEDKDEDGDSEDEKEKEKEKKGEGGGDGKEGEGKEDQDKDKDKTKSSMGLDVDDSSKDATLEGDREQRKKSILSHIPPED